MNRRIPNLSRVFQAGAYGRPNGGASPLLTGLIGYWKLENVNDSHTNSLTLTNNNSVAFSSGKVSNAAAFVSASSKYLSIASSSTISLGDEDFAIACWVYPTASAAQMVASKDQGVGREWYLFWNTNQFTFNINSGTAVSKTGLSINTWYFVVAEHDATANTITIAVNDGTVASTGTSGVYPSTGTTPLEIGRWTNNSGIYFDGLVDEFAMWRRKLTAGEKTQLYNSGNGVTYPSFT